MGNISVCIIQEDPKSLKEAVESLKGNEKFIKEIIYTGEAQNIPGVKFLNLYSENRAYLRNRCIQNAAGDFILWLCDTTQIEETTLEEYDQIIKKFPDVDIIYPNEIIVDLNGEENIKNYKDWYGNEIELIQGLTLENFIPAWAVLTKKEMFDRTGKFDEDFEDYEFYRLLVLNLKNLKLKHSEESFVTNRITESFIDTSYRSKTLRDVVELYDWKKEIFPLLGWDRDEKLALTTAYTTVGDRLKKYLDLLNASEFYRKAMLTFHNQYTLKKLIDTYISMGEFEKAIFLTEKQGLTDEEISNYRSFIDNIQKLIDRLESLVQEGSIKDVLSSINDVVEVYEGAPVYNILGVIHFILKDYENAFKFLIKAVTMNPVKEEYLENLFDVGKLLNKEEKVYSLLERLRP
ncbi:tetratricopeptide repeat-containing glycosyltransferase [Persephonella sp.]